MGDWRELLASALSQAEQDLAAASGDRSLCAISRGDGASSVRMPTVKMAEGGWAALRSLRDSDSKEELLHRIDEGMESARRQLELDRGQAWQAYATGALTELMRLQERLDAAAS